MKKIILCLLVAIILSNCEIKPREAKAEMTPIACGIDGSANCVTYKIVTVDGIEFAIFATYKGGVTTHNLTKEKLEIQLLQKQLNQK